MNERWRRSRERRRMLLTGVHKAYRNRPPAEDVMVWRGGLEVDIKSFLIRDKRWLTRLSKTDRNRTSPLMKIFGELVGREEKFFASSR